MLLSYPIMYRKYGVRVIFQLPNPHVFDTVYLELPQEAIYHYLNYDGSVGGPPTDEYLLRNIKHQIPMMHVSELSSFEGNPRYHAQNPNQLIKEYHHSHRHTRWLRDLSLGLRDRNTPIVYNYSLISKIYKYQQSVFANYYRWRNIFSTMLSQVTKASAISQRQHFIVVQAPRMVPSMSQLNLASKELTQSLIKVFNDYNAYILLELWKWVVANRKDSVFSELPPQSLHLFNLVFQQGGKWFVLNLGKLNAWRQPDVSEQADYDLCVEKVKQKSEPLQVAKRLLRMYMSASELQTLTSKTPIVEEKAITPEQQAELDEQDDENQIDTDEDESSGETVVAKPPKEDRDLSKLVTDVNKILDQLKSIEDTDRMEHDEFNAHMRQEDERIDEDLRSLEQIAANYEREVSKAKSQVKEIMADKHIDTHDQAVTKLCDKLANDGAISAAEHSRYSRLAQTYKTIVSPDGVTTLDEFIKIDPATLKVVKDKPMVDQGSVVDKSMLHSTLNDFDSRYVKEVLHKDVAGSVLAVQNAGVAVTNYQVKVVEDVMGEYEQHVIKITPVIGVPSTLRFKLPKLDASGNWTSNGIKYLLRKQRGD